MGSTSLPTLDDILAAQQRIKGVASRTPLVQSPSLSKRYGRRVFLKLECFQPIRVFKIRGAYNKISRIKERHVVAASSGNHGIAVAFSCWLLGKKCTIVVPETAVQEKVDMIQEYGGEIVRAGRVSYEREAEARELAKKNDAVFVHPFNDPDIIAGQGTCGLEIADQLAEFDSVVVPVGGGGLISGIAVAVKSLKRRVQVFGVEPEGAAKLTAALKANKPVAVESPNSIADGLIPASVGDLTFEACKKYVDGVLTASDDEILSAMRLLIQETHIFPEPSGAAAAAPFLTTADSKRLGERVVLVISGGNVSLDLLAKTIRSNPLEA